MAEPSTKDRDLNVPTAETSSASGACLPNSAKARNKLLALKLNSSSGPKKQAKKVIMADKLLVFAPMAVAAAFEHLPSLAFSFVLFFLFC